jgi:enoyl-CoA hydratase/carnithine racemase
MVNPPNPSEDVLTVERNGQVCVLTLNRPGQMNALSLDLRGRLAQAIGEFEADDELRVAILTGAGGRAFSAGADLKEVAARRAKATPRSPVPGRPDVPVKGNMIGFDEVDAASKPIIAAIDGYCLAGGFELALSCDIRLATRQSTFGLPEPRRGMLPTTGLIHLSRMVPLGEALRVLLTGSAITADRAYEIGLISAVAADREELLATAHAIAGEILACAPLAVQYIKRIVRGGRDQSVDQQWQLAEMYLAAMRGSEDAREGPLAFAEKRPPRWQAR